MSSEIRDRDKKVPIIFLSVKSLEEDVLKGFQLDIDDYIIKPFRFEELLMRIQAILRRTAIPEEEVAVFQLNKTIFDYENSFCCLKRISNLD